MVALTTEVFGLVLGIIVVFELLVHSEVVSQLTHLDIFLVQNRIVLDPHELLNCHSFFLSRKRVLVWLNWVGL